MVFMFFTTFAASTGGRRASTSGSGGSACRRKRCYGRRAIRDEGGGAKRIAIGIGNSGHPGVWYRCESLQVVNDCGGGISAVGIGIFSLLKELGTGSRVGNIDRELLVCKVGNVEIESNLSRASIGIQGSANHTSSRVRRCGSTSASRSAHCQW